MNRYFLLIAFLQLIKEITPVNPLTTWAPLVIIFSITAVKGLLSSCPRLLVTACVLARHAHVCLHVVHRCVCAVRAELVDDIGRRNADKKANERPYFVVEHGRAVTVCARRRLCFFLGHMN
jgi:hypothetical protein